MADGYLFKSDFARNASDFSLMLRKLIGMHEGNCDRLIALFFKRTQCGGCLGRIERFFDCAVCTDAFIQLGHTIIKRFWLDDFGRKDVFAFLITDAQSVTEALGGDKCQPFPLTLQKCIRGNGRAHAHFANQPCWNWLASSQAKMQTDAVNGCILIS